MSLDLKLDFNPLKILLYKEQLMRIQNHQMPYPVMLEIDPVNYCNFHCPWCSSGSHLSRKTKDKISMERFHFILDFIDSCQTVQGIYWCGGGEPLLNENLVEMARCTKIRGIQNYLTTNGSLLNRFEDIAYFFKWIAVSVNAGTEKLWKETSGSTMSWKQYLKGLSKMNENVRKTSYCQDTNMKCVFDTKTYEDIDNVYDLAVELGFSSVTIKPADLFLGKEKRDFYSVWGRDIIMAVEHSIARIKERNKNKRDIKLECGGFYGFFDVDKREHLHFDKCWTSMMAPVFTADGQISICCVRRSLQNVGRWDDGNLKNYWGSEEHHKKVFGFDPKKVCPSRCKMGRYNEIFQSIFIDGDSNFSRGHI
jgi:MoaA/NifB/PqqE/SkfB family radical SAM enzyme